MSGDFDRNLGARIPGADDENAPVPHLRAVAVFTRVQLAD
jgi:hypothetical protein